METLQKKALFWDADLSELDPKRHRRYIIERILALGDIDDFHWVSAYYGADQVRNVFLNARGLDPKSQNFWSLYFNVKEEK